MPDQSHKSSKKFNAGNDFFGVKSFGEASWCKRRHPVFSFHTLSFLDSELCCVPPFLAMMPTEEQKIRRWVEQSLENTSFMAEAARKMIFLLVESELLDVLVCDLIQFVDTKCPGACAEARDYRGWSPLHAACRMGINRVLTIKHLASRGASPMTTGGTTCVAMLVASSMHDSDVIHTLDELNQAFCSQDVRTKGGRESAHVKKFGLKYFHCAHSKGEASPLMEACAAAVPRGGTIQRMIAAGANVNAKSKWKDSILHMTLGGDQPDHVAAHVLQQIQLSSPRLLTDVNAAKWSPLHMACASRRGRRGCIKHLIHLGAHVRDLTMCGSNLVHLLIQSQKEDGTVAEMIEYLSNNLCWAQIREAVDGQGMTVLMLTLLAGTNRTQTLIALVLAGVSLNAVTDSKPVVSPFNVYRRVLCCAVHASLPDAAMPALRKFLRVAVEEYPELLEMRIASKTFLHVACTSPTGSPALVHELVSAGACARALEEGTAKTMIHLLLESNFDPNELVVLVRRTVYGWPDCVRTTARDGATLLHFAYGRMQSAHDCTWYVTFLQRRGADIRALTKNRSNVLHELVGSQQPDRVVVPLAQEIINKVPEFMDGVNADSRTPLLVACASGVDRMNTITFLLQQGANVKTRTTAGCTAAHELAIAACLFGSDFESSRALKKIESCWGGIFHVFDNIGNTPLQILAASPILLHETARVLLAVGRHSRDGGSHESALSFGLRSNNLWIARILLRCSSLACLFEFDYFGFNIFHSTPELDGGGSAALLVRYLQKSTHRQEARVRRSWTKKDCQQQKKSKPRCKFTLGCVRCAEGEKKSIP